MIEQQIIAQLIIDNNLYYKFYSVLNDNIFSNPQNRRIFAAFETLLTSGKEVDIISLSEHTQIHLDTFAKITSEVNYTISFSEAIRKLSNIQLTNKITALTVDIQQKLKDKENPENIVSFIEDRLILEGKKDIVIKSFNDNIKELLEHIKINKHHKGLTGVPAGFEKMDERTGGFQKSDLIIMAGETSQGKTSLALTAGKNAAKQGKKVVFFSLEMGDIQLTARIMSQESEISSKKLILGKLDYTEDTRLNESVRQMKDKNIFIDECASTSLSYITDKIKIYKIKENIDIAIVDYLQLVSNEKRGASKEQQVGEVARRFKNLARQLNIPIILLSQLSREKGGNRPTLGRLRDSGQIEEASDIVIFIHRPEMYNNSYFEHPFESIESCGKAEIIHAKGRNIGIGSYLLDFSPRLTLFKNEQGF